MKKTPVSLSLSKTDTPTKLLIFDNDGTLVNADLANWQATNFYLKKLDFPQNSLKTVRSFMGEPAKLYYPHLIQGRDKSLWKKFQLLVESNYQSFFDKSLKVYPDVKRTLTALKNRGYKLVLYSNAPNAYLSKALKASGLKPYFHAIYHLQNGQTKASQIKKIVKRFKLPAAVIGDRVHDYEAATKNKLPSIACTYGFGNIKEYRHATHQIKKFSDLLKIFK